MKRLIPSLAVLLVASVATADVAAAQNPHFVGQPSCTELTTTVRCSGSAAGLGGENIDVTISATGIAQVQCSNPAGNVAPGQATTVSASGTVSNLEVKNGRVNFTVTTNPPPAPNPAVVCPNAKWTATITSVNFSSATLSIIQPTGSGNVVLTQTFTL